jgi:hypothetical protein
MNIIKISTDHEILGRWTKTTKETEITCKFYYKKRQIVWEFVDRGLKHKIEVEFEKIAAICVNLEPQGMIQLIDPN